MLPMAAGVVGRPAALVAWAEAAVAGRWAELEVVEAVADCSTGKM